MKQTEQCKGDRSTEASGLRRCEPQRKRNGIRSLEIQRWEWPSYSEGLKPALATGKITETRNRTLRGKAEQRAPKEALGTWETHPGDGQSRKALAEDNNASSCWKWESEGLVVATKGSKGSGAKEPWREQADSERHGADGWKDLIQKNRQES